LNLLIQFLPLNLSQNIVEVLFREHSEVGFL
jgi:hypothetical protein